MQGYFSYTFKGTEQELIRVKEKMINNHEDIKLFD